MPNRPPTTNPNDTAGFKWHPEICPIAKAIVNTVNPNANETPSQPIPTSGTPAASTAAPQPPNVNQNVPKNSAPHFLANVILLSFLCVEFFARQHSLRI